MTVPGVLDVTVPAVADPIAAALAGVPGLDGLDLARASIEPLGGVTNRSHRVALGGSAWVVRVPGRAAQHLVDRAAEGHNAAAAAARGLTVPDLFFDAATGVKVTRWLPRAAPLGAEDLQDPACLRQVAALLGALHRSGIAFAPAFSPRCFFADARAAFAARGRETPPALIAAAASHDRCLDLLDRLPAERAPCHQDLWRENLLRTDDGLLLIDWEHSAPGDPLYDLADLSAQCDLGADAEQLLLEAWLGRAAEPTERARLRLNKALSCLVWGAWSTTRALFATGADAAALTDAGARKLARGVALMPSIAASPARPRDRVRAGPGAGWPSRRARRTSR